MHVLDQRTSSLNITADGTHNAKQMTISNLYDIPLLLIGVRINKPVRQDEEEHFDTI